MATRHQLGLRYVSLKHLAKLSSQSTLRSCSQGRNCYEAVR